METQFLWTQNWYPVIPLNYLDVSCPTALTLLDKKLVIISFSVAFPKKVYLLSSFILKFCSLNPGFFDKLGLKLRD
ncbi:hypothetical protein WN50_14735 [Limnoraphis robusta CS-951]|uniref:Uncharacterized protein n=1 Tax=Limnoraphis robusta CS-951 TaxID=1637645 RepID=A0A0F5YEL4_9CYAN|nr:hypothetical protein WN50_14735 [Limnoraphis robusta CS-951]